ncbi:MAG: hypothetical protein B7Y02_00540 [Rhodobacterales bacterium 17-64-5]|nr:MAG: hypothetical protein B7Y02_00540 [Rhodobacterales bacterium 17-64-5]
MQDVWIKFTVSDEQAAILRQPTGVLMAIPMLSAEVVPFGVKVNTLAEAMAFFRRCLSTLRQSLEAGGNKDGQIGKTLDKMLSPVSDAEVIIHDLRVLIGSAVFVGHEDTKGRMQ